MSVRITVRITGIEQVVKAMKEIGLRQSANVIRNSIHSQASQARDEVRANAPVHPVDVVKYKKGEGQKITKKGTLKRAIKAKRRKPEQGNSKFRSNVIVEHGNNVKNDAYYWHMVEYGTIKMPAQPFIAPVIKKYMETAEPAVRQEVIERIEQKLQRAIDA
jgi:HK97 gp10 family phage protein